MNQRLLRIGLALLVVGACRGAMAQRVTTDGPLAKYVAKEDTSYRWFKKQEGKIGSTSYAELILTSQIWRDIVWKHQLFIIKPSTVAPNASHGMLFIAGGSWRDELSDPAGETKLPREASLLATLAEQMKTPVAILLHVPQQPIFGGKREDAIIAYTFDEYLKTSDSEWPLLLPMVKSAVRGMDAVTEYSEQTWSLKLKSFTVTGGSKRGWTTWLTGAIDARATHLAPMVIDVLNMVPQMKHQRATWGKPSEQIEDYTQRDLDKKMDTPAGEALRAIIDPYSYRAILTQPKLVILGTNDPYWPLDAANLYWDGLSGQKHLLYIPNNGHSLNDVARLVGGLNALNQQAITGKPLPKMSWKFSNGDGKLKLRLDSDTKPSRVNTWIATSPTKDFRPAKWNSHTAQANGDGHICELPLPKDGYAAMFGEAVFDGPTLPYFLSTNVRIVKAGETAAP